MCPQSRPPLTRDEAEGCALLMILAAHALVIASTVICFVTKNRPSIVATGVVEIALYCYTCRFLRSLKRRNPPWLLELGAAGDFRAGHAREADRARPGRRRPRG